MKHRKFTRQCHICKVRLTATESPWVSVTWDGQERYSHDACEKARAKSAAKPKARARG